MALGAGAASALLNLSPLFVGITPGSLILTALGPLAPLAVGLGMGAYSGALATGCAAVIVAVATSVTTGGWFVLTNVLPTVLVVYLAVQSRPHAGGTGWYPSGHILAWLTVLGIAYILGVAVYFSDTEGGYAAVGYELMRSVLERFAAAPDGSGVGIGPERVDAFARQVGAYLPGVWVSFWELLFIANAVLAQGLLVRFGRNIRPPSALAALESPRWFNALGAVVVLACFVPGAAGGVAQNLLLVVAIPFFFLGLAVIHALARRWRGLGAQPFFRLLFLVLFYFVLMTMVWPAFVLVGIGIVDSVAGIRRRLGGTGPDEEEK